MNTMIVTLALKRWRWLVPLSLIHMFGEEMLLVSNFIIGIQSILFCNNTVKQELILYFPSV